MKSNRICIVSIQSIALLLCIALPASALWGVVDVAANGVYGNVNIAVKIMDHDQFKDFEVAFTPQKKDFPAALDGRLNLTAKNEMVALVPVSEKREKGVVTYWFRVTPEAIEKSTFEIFSRGLARNKKREEHGGVIYAVKLKAFASPAAH